MICTLAYVSCLLMFVSCLVFCFLFEFTTFTKLPIHIFNKFMFSFDFLCDVHFVDFAFRQSFPAFQIYRTESSRHRGQQGPQTLSGALVRKPFVESSGSPIVDSWPWTQLFSLHVDLPALPEEEKAPARTTGARTALRRASYSVAQPAPTGRVSVVPARAASARSEQVTPLARRRWHRALTTLAAKGPLHETDQRDSCLSQVDTSTHTSARKTVADMTSMILYLR